MRTRKVETTEQKRVPVSGNRDVLTVAGKEDGYVYRWVNDSDNRIMRFKEAGYEIVDADVQVGIESVNQATNVGKVVSKNVGKGVTSYLMRIKREWYEEDQLAKQRDIADKEATMKRTSREDGRYGSISIERK